MTVNQGTPFNPYTVRLPTKRKVFISYHHEGDQTWFDYFSNLFGEHYDLFHNRSLNEPIYSDDANYISRAIREDRIKGTSITIVLCGVETWKRKHVDWETHSTLLYEHALLGIALPTAQRSQDNKVTVLPRLHDNVVSGYAHWMDWTEDPLMLKRALEVSILQSQKKQNIKNTRPQMGKNLP